MEERDRKSIDLEKPFELTLTDVDKQLAESARLLAEIDSLMQRARVIIVDQQRIVAVIKEKQRSSE